MFTGIIEDLGRVEETTLAGTNMEFTISSVLKPELKIDQSVAHNGVCLTVTSLEQENRYKVTAIKETLDRTNLGSAKVGDVLNLERCMIANGRIDGHIVQGHVDQTGSIKSIKSEEGSWVFGIKYDPKSHQLTVAKGSICVNGVSLTVVDSQNDFFSVAIIPYTYEHTTFKDLKVGDLVNLEFDILGKYIQKYLSQAGKL
ncbi:MAG: riboflavin synthase [Flavobacteriales bacterium]|nr:riboflavin synthase [Flavobacteriales bacterium]